MNECVRERVCVQGSAGIVSVRVCLCEREGVCVVAGMCMGVLARTRYTHTHTHTHTHTCMYTHTHTRTHTRTHTHIHTHIHTHTHTHTSTQTAPAGAWITHTSLSPFLHSWPVVFLTDKSEHQGRTPVPVPGYRF